MKFENNCKKYNDYILGLIEKWAKRLDASECTINTMGEITLMNKDGAICNNYTPDLQEIKIFND